MTRYLKTYSFPIIILIYILGNAYIMTFNKSPFYAYNLLPAFLLVAYTATFHLQNLVFILAFCTPLSVTLKEMGMSKGLDLSLPAEPLMAGIMVVYILNMINSQVTDRKFLRHPVTLIVIIQLLWMLVTTFTSTDMVVSVKYLIARLWFVFSCYVIIPHLFQSSKNIVFFVFCYSAALLIVVIYASVLHAAFLFNDKAADWVVSPFYNDHTAYGAALSMFIPVLLSFVFRRSLPFYVRMISLGLFFVFVLALVFSYARASWVSIVGILLIYATLLLKIKFRTLLITIVSLVVLYFAFQTEILFLLGRNTTDAVDGFENNIESVANISTDASNLERLNRWSCAVRMWNEKPVFGFGPGTYMFKYAPYQLSKNWTSISTNFGNIGNAHSEYLGPLAEQGTMGLLIMLFLLFYVTAMGYRLHYSLKDREDKALCTALFLGLMTYLAHGFFNNFLDTDKLSLPFWAFLAGMVCFDLYYVHKKKEDKPQLPEEPVTQTP